MSLAELRDTWNQLAKKDAMWAVLSGPVATERKWDARAFFQTGVAEIDFVLGRVRAVGGAPGSARALDFGCGPGRLTQALAQHFEQVDGVDIAPEMIRQAQLLNRAGERCRYQLNEAADLAIFPDAAFDFVYSNITLQHMEPRFSTRYIEEFIRVLRSGGVAVFQLPGEAVPIARPRTLVSGALAREACRATIEAPASIRCAPGARFTLVATVRNDGSSTWPALVGEDRRYAIRLGNHWRSRFGRMLRLDDVRNELPHDLAPGEVAGSGLDITAPGKPGRYVLELDMVQEHVRWFAETGSRPRRVRVHVDAALRPGEAQGLPAQMAMHAIPRRDVEALIARAGGVLLAVDDDDAPGPDFTSYRYVARRAAV